ncbi:transposase [Xenorhabdus beddingii]|uniref:Transposase n=1 Tax=Xenorhabdus beddingii TaxID=40578 RepID=A0A1Y2S989_9GAMM|nr:hypothetical protein [Xenorhabdus beddingii]OTA14444.1 transposase [Xenorhabdus beddingii]
MSQQDFIIWVFCWVDDNLTQLQQGKAVPTSKDKPIMGTAPPKTKLTTASKAIS